MATSSSDSENDDVLPRFTIDSETDRQYNRFNATGTELTVRLLPPAVGDNSDAITHFQASVNDLFQYAQLDSLWRGVFYTVSDGDFSMHSATAYKTAILSLGTKKQRRSLSIKFTDLRYLTYIFPLLQDQLTKYSAALPDLMTCNFHTTL
jgi:hypothetical protein